MRSAVHYEPAVKTQDSATLGLEGLFLRHLPCPVSHLSEGNANEPGAWNKKL
jgi:hypothetical protein